MKSERKVAVITGASRGIGTALVRAYRDIGYHVVASSRSIDKSQDPSIPAVDGDIASDLERAAFVTDEIMHVDGGASAGRW
jgi:NAD(P)-dependent dehydrogenase (short-subunit alcohol dehydrogenase family)